MSNQRVQPAAYALPARGITKRQLAARMGKTPAYVGRVLNGYAKPSERFRAELAAILDLPVELLFDDTPCTCRAEPSQEQLSSLLRAAKAS